MPELSVCMAVTPKGVLIYIGTKGKIYKIVGGKNGILLLTEHKQKP